MNIHHRDQNYFIKIDEKNIPINIKKHYSSRKITISYLPLKQSINITIPKRCSTKQAIKFANEKYSWITNQINQYKNIKEFHDKQIISVLGKDIMLRHIGGRGTTNQKENILFIYGDSEFMKRRVKKWLIQELRNNIVKISTNYANKIGVTFGKINIRDTSTHWGSCSTKGNLSFSIRLIFAPYEILEYVIAHEIAHIKEHNHSKYFWDLVETIYPNFREAEKWLKENSKSLYMYEL
ncbi:MAG: SprT family zinc-dependent metalloprotease [Rickettsiales bacterium]